MKLRRLARSLLPVLILLVLMVLTGCSFSIGGDKGRRASRGKVSDVAQAAASTEQTGERTKVDHEQTEHTWLAPDEEDEESDDSLPLAALIAASAGDADADSDTDLPLMRPNLLLWYAQADPAGDTVERMTSYTLAYSAYQGDRIRVHFGLYYGDGKRGSQMLVQEGMDSVREYGADVGGRHYLTSGHTLAGIYFLGGVRAGQLYWSYANAVTVVDTDVTETIESDAIWMMAPYFGLGLSPLQTEAAQLGLNLTYGGRFTLFETNQGFENDVFKDVGELKLNVEAGLFF